MSRRFFVAVAGVLVAGLLVSPAAGDPLPAPTITDAPEVRTSLTTASFSFSSTDADNFRCKLDEQVEEPCISGITYPELPEDPPLAEGLHHFSVWTVGSGQPSASAEHEWTIDVTPPQISLVAPASGATTADVTPTVAGTLGTATGDSATVVVEIREGTADGELVDTPPASVGEGGAWSATPSTALDEEATYVARATQSDDVGNVGTAETTFVVDVPFVALAAPDGLITKGLDPLTITGTADGGAVSVDIYPEGSEEPAVAGSTTTLQADGPWSVTLDPPTGDGPYTIVARHFSGGTVADASATAPLIVDAAAPTVVVPDDIVAEAKSEAGAVVTFTATAEDALDAAPSVACDPPSGETFALAAPTTVTCTATDHAGNESAPASFLVTVQNTLAPARVADFTARARDRIVALSWQPPQNWDYDHVVISRARVGGTWRVIATTTETRFADVSVTNDRIYRYRIASVDVAGNRSVAVERRARPSAFYEPAYLERVRAPVELRWTAVPRATYYNVQVWRSGRKILSRWPERARYDLRSSWRFGGRLHRLRAGTYTVYAWPGYGPKRAARYGDLRGWTRFVVR